MVGMLPYSFTVTSHTIVTLIMALFIFIAVTILGFIKHGFNIAYFEVEGVPTVLPLITIIEIISYLRPVSLFARLFANMMAGHTIQSFGGFVVSLGILGGWLPLFSSINWFEIL